MSKRLKDLCAEVYKCVHKAVNVNNKLNIKANLLWVKTSV